MSLPLQVHNLRAAHQKAALLQRRKVMKKNSLLIAIPALFTLLSLTAGVFAGKNSATPVTSTLQDIRADNTPYRLHSDSPLSGKSYYSNGVDSVVSQLQSSPEWELSALSSTTRKMFVDFNDRFRAAPLRTRPSRPAMSRDASSPSATCSITL